MPPMLLSHKKFARFSVAQRLGEKHAHFNAILNAAIPAVNVRDSSLHSTYSVSQHCNPLSFLQEKGGVRITLHERTPTKPIELCSSKYKVGNNFINIVSHFNPLPILSNKSDMGSCLRRQKPRKVQLFKPPAHPIPL